MPVIKIKGGNPLKGRIKASGAKNAALPILAATVLAPASYSLKDIPRLKDVAVMIAVLRELGAKVNQTGNEILVDTTDLNKYEIPDQLMRKMRASILFMGPLLGRFGKARISQPGGCSIGPRPIDMHIKGLRALGASFNEEHGYLICSGGPLKGKEIHLDFPSVGATENIMLGAAKAEGLTVIRNAAKEPEIVDLQNFLNAMGANIRGAGTDIIKVEGVQQLHGAKHTIIPDRIEIATFLIAAAVTKGSVIIDNVIVEHLDAVLAKLKEAGYRFEARGDSIRLLSQDIRPSAVDIKTLPYPGFATDMQPQIMALLSVARGTSVITETVFENRFKHAEELKRMGAKIRLEGRTAIIHGIEKLSGAFVESPPALRAGAALVLAGLAAEGETIVNSIDHIERGYENLVGKLASLGAEISIEETHEYI